MADLSSLRPTEGGEDSGQLILISGVLLATVLVLLVLLVNTAIYADNLATREGTIEARDAGTFRQTAVETVGVVVDAENREGYADHATVRSAVTDSMADAHAMLRRQYVQDGRVVTIDNASLSFRDGYLVRHTDESKTFESADTAELPARQSDWTLAWNVTDARRHRMTVDRDSLAATGDPADAFQVVVAGNGSSDEWRLAIYENGSHVLFAVENGSESTFTELTSCAVEGEAARIDLTSGEVNGTHCGGIDWGRGVDSRFDVKHVNGQEATGTYELTVTESSGMENEVDTYLLEPTSTDSPRYAFAVYSVQVDITYRNRAVDYGTRVRVAPGEPS